MLATRFTGFMALALLLALGLAALTLLAQAGNSGLTLTASRAKMAAAPSWLNGRQTAIEAGLPVSPHAAKHNAEALDALRIYNLLLQGKCAAADRFCDSNGRQLYLCFDAVTGLLGGIFVKDGIIESGWGARPTYWAGKVRGAGTPFRADRCYH